MNYLDLYRKRCGIDGTTSQDRIENRLSQDFKRLIQMSPNRIVIEYENELKEAILQSGNAGVGTQTEKKVIQYLLTENSLKFNEGVVFKTVSEKDGERNWIILHREIHPYDGYFKYKVLELNYNLNYINSNGVLKTIPAYINGTGDYDIKEYFIFADRWVLDRPNQSLNIIISNNNDIVDKTLFYIGDLTWRFVDKDNISIPGVWYATLNKVATNKDNISSILNVANTSQLNNTIIYNSCLFSNNNIIINEDSNSYFYSKTNGYMNLNNNFSYIVKNGEIIEIVNDIIIPKEIGETDITVSSSEGVVANFHVSNSLIVPNYLNLIGSNKIKIGFNELFKIATNYTNLSFELENPELGILKYDETNGTLLIKSKKIGNTNILCKSNNELIKNLPIEFVSLVV